MSIKVLVADDSITIQKVIGIIFGGDEYSLTVVDNGKAAVEKAREFIPDILLIDALMPGMSGYEVAEAIRSTPSLAAKPILILTGSFEPFDEEKARKCGADDFIAKPFESQQIISKVKELLVLGSSRAEAAQPVSVPTEVFLSAAETPSPDSEQQNDVMQSAATADIWSAFTQDVEPPVESTDIPVETNVRADAFEPDVFSIVSEENDIQLIQSHEVERISPQHTGSQWVPVEENTFEFEEESVAEPPRQSFAEQTAPVQDAFFGEIAFEEDSAAPPVTPAFAPVSEEFFTAPEPELPTPAFTDFVDTTSMFEEPAAPFKPLSDPVPACAAPVESAPPAMAVAAAAVPAALTEEQLKAALAVASKEVIERIVWEIVPDLADALIRDAIRKIKEGV